MSAYDLEEGVVGEQVGVLRRERQGSFVCERLRQHRAANYALQNATHANAHASTLALGTNSIQSASAAHAQHEDEPQTKQVHFHVKFKCIPGSSHAKGDLARGYKPCGGSRRRSDASAAQALQRHWDLADSAHRHVDTVLHSPAPPRPQRL